MKPTTKQLSKAPPRIVQILIGPETSRWQSRLIGLDSEGRVLSADKEGWKVEYNSELPAPAPAAEVLDAYRKWLEEGK